MISIINNIVGKLSQRYGEANTSSGVGFYTYRLNHGFLNKIGKRF